MQYSGLVPLYYHHGDHSKGFSWHVFNGNVNYGDYYGIIKQQSLKNQYFNYNKEVIRQMIQNQDETFRYQVQELHRLYKNQRDLMDDVRNREIFTRDFDSQTLKSVPCSSQARLDTSRVFTSQLLVLNNAEKYRSSTVTRTFKEEECTLLKSDTDQGVDDIDTRDCNARENKSKLLFDLNEPLKPDDQGVQEEAKQETSGLLRHEIDLNTVPLNVLSKSEVSYGNRGETGSEAPDNKESSRSSEDRIAAETLQVMMRSNFVSTKNVGTLNNSLSWFADIASTMGGDLDYKDDQSQLLESAKVKGKTQKLSHIVRKETASDMTYLAFSCSDNVKKSKSSISKKSIARAKQCFMRNWGKMKQRGDHRRRKYLIVS